MARDDVRLRDEMSAQSVVRDKIDKQTQCRDIYVEPVQCTYAKGGTIGDYPTNS